MVDFFSGYNPSIPGSGDNDPNPTNVYENHGTACAGVAVARGNNGTGVASAAYTAKLLPIRYSETQDASGSGLFNTDGLAEAIRYAGGKTEDESGTWRGADIMSMSFSFSPPSSSINSAMTWAESSGRGGTGCPLFAATGNGASGDLTINRNLYLTLTKLATGTAAHDLESKVKIT